MKLPKPREIFEFALIAVNGILLMSLIMQDTSKSCPTYAEMIRVFCFGTPDIFTHSIEYTLIFLRGGIVVNGSHWSSEILIPVLFFSVMFLQGNIVIAAVTEMFFAFWHELIWVSFMYAHALNTFSPAWLLMLIFVCGAIFVLYKKIYLNWRFFAVNTIFAGYMALWWYFDDLHVTVEGKFLTQYYDSLLTNSFEVGSWTLTFIIFLVWNIKYKYSNSVLKSPVEVI